MDEFRFAISCAVSAVCTVDSERDGGLWASAYASATEATEGAGAWDNERDGGLWARAYASAIEAMEGAGVRDWRKEGKVVAMPVAARCDGTLCATAAAVDDVADGADFFKCAECQ